MRICILGATGTLGRAVARKLLDATTADLVLSSRHAKETLLPTECITVIDGDATVPEDAEKVVESADMVFCAISGAELPAAVRTVVEAMKRTGANRLVVTCAVGIYDEIPEEMDGKDNVSRNQDQVPNREAADIAEQSGLDYTILRPGYLRDGDEDDFVLSFKGEPARGYITTLSSVATLVARIAQDPRLCSGASVSITKDFSLW